MTKAEVVEGHSRFILDGVEMPSTNKTKKSLFNSISFPLDKDNFPQWDIESCSRGILFRLFRVCQLKKVQSVNKLEATKESVKISGNSSFLFNVGV